MSRITTSTLPLPLSQLVTLATSTSTSPITICLTAYSYLLFRATGVDSADVAMRVTCGDESHELRIITRATMNVTEYVHAIYNAIPSSTSILSTSITKSKQFTTHGDNITITIQQQRSMEAPMAALDATLIITPSGDDVSYHIYFAYDPLPTRGIADVRKRCVEHMQEILTSISSHPTSTLSSLSVLDATERHLLMHEFSGRQQYNALTPTDACLHDLYETTASKYPLNTALVYEKQTMTYAEMDARCNQLARYMRSQGIGVGSFVAMFLPRSMDVYIALIAILKAGATYVPIDPEYPADRVQYILTDCKVKILLTRTAMLTPALQEVMPSHTTPICMDTFQLTMSKERLTRKETGVTNRDLSYVIYTSGSTGRPKGVMIEHRSAVNLVRAEQLIYQMTPQDRVYQGFSIAFDASVEEVWMAFHNGAALVIATHEMIHAGPGLCPILQELQVTALSTVPTLISMMDQDIPSIKLLIMGGEACPKDLAERWSRGRRMYNTYGPTEATVICTYALMDADAPIVTIGKPVPTYFSYILDPSLQPVPVGVTGELHIGGICLSRGYVGREDLTAEKFIPFPKSLYDPDVDMLSMCPALYKTGDLARYTEDGEIEFCGRIDQQVKIRGFRVELSEIESVMMKMGGKTMAAVVAVREDVPGIQNLVGYVKFSSPNVNEAGFGPHQFDENRFKDLLRVPLPPYMIPSSITILDDFPTLPSGKVNRKALPAPKIVAVVDDDDDDDDVEGDEMEAKHDIVETKEEKPVAAPVAAPAAPAKDGYEPPRTPMEKKLCDVWKKLFQRKKISVTDDFFKLGGHSLLAAWLVTALRKDKDTNKVTMTDIYGAPTIRGLAQRLGGGVPVIPTPTPVAAPTVAAAAAPVASVTRVAFAPKKSVLKNKGNDMETPLLDDVDADVDVEEDDDEEEGETLPMDVGISVNGQDAEPLSDAQIKLEKDFHPTSYASYIICGFFQLLSMFALFAFPAFQVGIPYELFLEIRRDDTWPVVGWFLAAAASIYPAYIMLCVGLKWILIGRYQEGRYPLWGWYYFRWWLVQRIKFGVPTMYLRGTLLMNFFLRCMGAKIGNNVFLNTHMFDAPDLIEIGDDTSIGLDAQLSNFTIQNGYLIIERIRIGKRCYVGARGVLHGNTRMHDDSHLGLMSMLPHGTVVPTRQHWRGSPAQAFKSPVPEFEDALGRIPPSGSFANSSNAARRQSQASRAVKAGGEDSPSSVFVSLQSSSDVDDVLVVHPQGWFMKMVVLIGQLNMLLWVMPGIIILGFAPGLLLLHTLLPSPNYVPNLRQRESYYFLVTAIPTAVMFNLIVAGCVVVIRYVLMPFGVKPGDYRIHTIWYLRKWCIDNVMLMTLHTIHSMYATLYLVPWLKLLGARIGPKAELSTAHFTNPELLTVGEGSFVADNVYLGVATVHMGIMRIGEVHVGARTFLGNSAVIASGCHVGDDCLLGVLSTVPVDEESTCRDAQPPMYAAPDEPREGELHDGPARRLSDVLKVYNCPEPFVRVKNQSAWLGSPAMYLPARAASAESHNDSSTYNPTWGLYFKRLFIEFFRVNLPVAIYCVSLLILLGDLNVIKNQIVKNDKLFWALYPCYYMAAGVVICVFCALLKWVVVGQYQKGEHPLWSSFVWRTELEVGVRESMSHPYFIDYLRGTPFCAMWFRLLGANIGGRVYMDTCNITEPELVHVGDEAVLEGDCDLQTHLFEDRVMKCSRVDIGNRCAIGPLSVVLYDTNMGEGSSIHSLSLLMKGEELPAWTSWEGLPTRPAAPLSLEHAQREQQARVAKERVIQERLAQQQLIKDHPAVHVRKSRAPNQLRSSSSASSINGH